MGHAVASSGKCREEFDGGIDDDKPFRLDGHGQWEDEDALLWEDHAECQQNGIDGT